MATGQQAGLSQPCSLCSLCHLAKHLFAVGSTAQGGLCLSVEVSSRVCAALKSFTGCRERKKHFALVRWPDGTGEDTGLQQNTWRTCLLRPIAHPSRKLSCRAVKKQLLRLSRSLPSCFPHLLTVFPSIPFTGSTAVPCMDRAQLVCIPFLVADVLSFCQASIKEKSL